MKQPRELSLKEFIWQEIEASRWQLTDWDIRQRLKRNVYRGRLNVRRGPTGRIIGVTYKVNP